MCVCVCVKSEKDEDRETEEEQGESGGLGVARSDPKEQPWDVATESTQSPVQASFLEWDEKTKPAAQPQLREHSSERKGCWCLRIKDNLGFHLFFR